MIKITPNRISFFLPIDDIIFFFNIEAELHIPLFEINFSSSLFSPPTLKCPHYFNFYSLFMPCYFFLDLYPNSHFISLHFHFLPFLSFHGHFKEYNNLLYFIFYSFLLPFYFLLDLHPNPHFIFHFYFSLFISFHGN